jgi:hypothetical protein
MALTGGLKLVGLYASAKDRHIQGGSGNPGQMLAKRSTAQSSLKHEFLRLLPPDRPCKYADFLLHEERFGGVGAWSKPLDYYRHFMPCAGR